MKLSIAIFASALGLSAAMEVTPKADISASSRIGQSVLSKARRVEENNNADNEEISYTWVANMSLKFQGCYHAQIWNGEANGDEDVKISTQRLVRFRLCPSSSCTMENAAGCKEGYGDYIIGMEDYLQAYSQAVQQDQEYNCDYEKNYGDCICDGENQGDDFNRDYCEYDCYVGKGMEYCVDKNPYEEDNGNNNNNKNQQMNMEEMVQCSQLEINNNQRKLEDAQAVYYLGAYCTETGGSIHLGLFTEDTCSQFADANAGATTYKTLTGSSLPYSDTTLIGTECLSCKEPQEANQNGENQNNENDQADADQVKEVCENLYAGAGKCESNLSSSTVKYPNTNGCNFMEGVKIYRKNGSIIQKKSSLNTSASIFIGLFASSFVLFGGYAYYLKTKLDRAKVNLVSEE